MQFVRVFREFSPSEEDRSRKTFLPVKKDEILAVSWKDSSFAWLWVSRVRDFEESQKEGFIPSSHCRPVQYTSLEAVLSSASSLIVTENVDDEEMFFFDPMNAEGHADGPVLSPDLATLCWPMSSEQFVETVWRRRIFCVHGSVDRIETSRLAEDFPNAYETLLESSESPVVFMKTLQV